MVEIIGKPSPFNPDKIPDLNWMVVDTKDKVGQEKLEGLLNGGWVITNSLGTVVVIAHLKEENA